MQPVAIINPHPIYRQNTASANIPLKTNAAKTVNHKPEETQPETKSAFHDKANSFLDKAINIFGKYQDLFLKYLLPPLVTAPALIGMKSKSIFRNIFNISSAFIISFVGWCISMHIEKLQSETNLKPLQNKIKISYPFDSKLKDKFTTISDPRSHQGMYEHAIDFLMPMGTDILAARDGKVIAVNDSHPDHPPDKSCIEFDANGSIKRNDNINEILILGEDDLIQHYAHVKQNSAQVKVGDIVKANTKICESGHNGNSSEPHLHFTLLKKDETKEQKLVSVPIEFK